MAKRILIVDDTEDLLELFRLVLEEEGYQVELRSVPFEQAQEIEQIGPDLIILDLLFREEGSGWRMLDLLKQEPATAFIPVIVCTAARHYVQEHEDALVARSVRVIHKPFEVDALLALITEAVGASATAQEGADQA
jgi:CheY-like chemotaxis protein